MHRNPEIMADRRAFTAGSRVSRRRFAQGATAYALAMAGLPLLAGCGFLSSSSKQQPQAKRLGMLFSALNESVRLGALQYLSEHGYVEGRNLTVEVRESPDEVIVGPELTAELVRLQCDVILAVGGTARAAKKVTTTVPVVFIFGSDPVAWGLVDSLSHPGGNLTGVGGYGPELAGKLLQLFKEAIPTLARVGYLWEDIGPVKVMELEAAQETGRALGVEAVSLPTRNPDDFAGAFATALQERIDGLLVKGSPLTVTNRDRIIAFATQHRLPTFNDRQSFAERGGLLEYTTTSTEEGQQAGRFIYAIFQGAKPGDLPVFRFSKFDLTVNLTTAHALGVTIAPSILAQATRVIQ
jgi:putative ABC transport system substrate-binding protein